jgi:4'-phosphopantetheinyl transferase
MTTPDRLWLPPSADLALSNDDIHVWRTSLDLSESCVQRLRRTLSEDELNRAARFYFERDRIHFIVARGVLRDILSRYLGLAPGHLRFSYTSYGKPALVASHGGDTLNFNLSHSHGYALYAVTRGREIGVDIEYIRPDFATEEIAERFFSARETAALRALPGEVRHEAFFLCWTRKEAYIKARGEGLSHPLDQFDVSLIPGESARLLGTRGDPQELFRWSLQELFPGPGYAAALAAEGRDWRLACWQWPEEADVRDKTRMAR